MMMRFLKTIAALQALSSVSATTYLPLGVTLIPPAHVQGGVVEGSGTSVALTLPSTVASGDLVAGGIEYVNTGGVTVTQIKDDQNNIYTPVVDSPTGNSFTVASFYLPNITNAPRTITVTFSASVAFSGIIADEFKNVATVSPLDNHQGQFQSPSGTAPNVVSSGAAITQVAGDLIYGVSVGGAGTFTAGTGFTLAQQTAGTEYSEYLIQPAPGSIAATFTPSVTTNTSTVMMAFRNNSLQPLNNFYATDGDQSPVNAGPTAMYVAATNTTWFGWSGWQQVNGVYQIVAEVTTYNNGTGAWTPNVITNTVSLANDLHGVPTIVREPNTGCEYQFSGAHNSTTQISYTTTPDNPSAWSTTTLASGTYGGQTFPIGFASGGKLYAFWNGTGIGSSQQESVKVAIATINPSTCAPTFGAAADLVDTGGTSWLLATWGGITVGGKFAFLQSYAPVYPVQPVTNLYSILYDPATGNISNYGGGTVVTPGSQPVGLSSLNSNFLAYSSTSMDGAGQALDSSGTLRIVLVDTSGALPVLNEIHNSGSGWSVPHLIFTYPSGQAGTGEAVVNASGGIDVYYTDGTCSACTSYATGAGNIYRTSVTTGNVWNASSTLIAATGAYPYFGISPVTNGSPAARVTFSQTSTTGSGSNGLVIAGNLRSYAYGDNGFVTHP